MVVYRYTKLFNQIQNHILNLPKKEKMWSLTMKWERSVVVNKSYYWNVMKWQHFIQNSTLLK